MKLIADSGSTKTDWVFITSEGKCSRVQTSGINPFFRSAEDIVAEIRPVLLTVADRVEEVFYYGAGIVNEEKARIIRGAFEQLYGDVLCHIHSDVVGAARAVCGRKAGIVCILGTGSNACLYNGNAVVGNIPPLGFILGDEGSGSVMGRQLLGDYFKMAMPPDLRTRFDEQFHLDKDDVLNRVYRQARPNQYLAQFAVFLSREIHHPWCREFVLDNFRAFVRRNVLMLPQSRLLPVNFVGSIAYHFRDLLRQVLEEENLTIEQILKDPIDGLIKFHA